jgi:GNAT superfamily N-acetyltransferase
MRVTDMQSAHLSGIDAIQKSVYPTPLQESLSIFSNAMASPDSICLVAESEGQVAGYLLAYKTICDRKKFTEGFQPEPYYDAIYLHDLSVGTAFQGQGVAALILNEFLKRAAANAQFKKVKAIAIANALGFWKAKGFTELEPCEYNGQAAFYIEKLL